MVLAFRSSGKRVSPNSGQRPTPRSSASTRASLAKGSSVVRIHRSGAMKQIAQAALAILGGATSESPRTYVVEFQSPVYDWRKLRSWNIDEQRLPRGSEVRFRPPSLWEEHRVAIIATLGVVISQSGLITAHEDERRRPPRTMC